MAEVLRSPACRAASADAHATAKNVFVCHSHRDVDALQRLMVHLRPIERRGLVDIWADDRLAAGDKWRDEIRKALGRSSVAILLISADFLASDFIAEYELPRLLRKAEGQGTRIIQVILKPCRFSRDRDLARFHAVNDPMRPLVTMSVGEQEAVYDQIAHIVERLVAS